MNYKGGRKATWPPRKITFKKASLITVKASFWETSQRETNQTCLHVSTKENVKLSIACCSFFIFIEWHYLYYLHAHASINKHILTILTSLILLSSAAKILYSFSAMLNHAKNVLRMFYIFIWFFASRKNTDFSKCYNTR